MEKFLVKFEGQEVMILMKADVNFDFKGDYLVRLKDVAEALEYERAENVQRLCKPDQVFKVKNSDFAITAKTKLNNTGELFITNLALNRVFGKSEMPKAESFQDWLYDEVLPSIQEHGGYLRPDATKEQVKALTDYHPTNLYETFLNATVNTGHLNNMITECMNFYKSAPYHKPVKQNALYKKKMFKAIRKALNKLRLENGNQSNFGEVLTLDNVLLSLADREQKAISTSSNGKIKYRNNKIHKLELSQDELKGKIDYLTPELDDYYLIDYSPFSENYMYEHNEKINKWVKTKAFKNWIADFPYEDLPYDTGVDWNKPIKMYLAFVHKKGADVPNLHKGVIDLLFKHYGYDDYKIEDVDIRATRIGTVNNYKDGKIYFLLRNV